MARETPADRIRKEPLRIEGVERDLSFFGKEPWRGYRASGARAHNPTMTHAMFLAAILFSGFAAQTPPPTPAPSQALAIEGVRNYTRVDAKIGCAGATDVKALPALSKQGFKAVLNLREATETGVNIEESRAASEAVGLKYIHLPFQGSAPDPKVADEFLRVVTDPANQPLFIHCAAGNRVGALWLIKRMVIDKWKEERAVAEARTIGLSSDALRKFAVEYVATRKD